VVPTDSLLESLIEFRIHNFFLPLIPYNP